MSSDLDITKSIAGAYLQMKQPQPEVAAEEVSEPEVQVEETPTETETVEEAKKAPKTDKEDDGEGMDPVGSGDSDIDNDGDSDAADKYLKMRRKKISQAIKKDEVNEVEEPRAKGEKDFKDKHAVKKTDATPK